MFANIAGSGWFWTICMKNRMFQKLRQFVATILLRPWVWIALLFAMPLQALPYVHTYAETDAPLYYGEFFWDESGAPRARPEIVVDLRAEQLYVYRGGVEIARAVGTTTKRPPVLFQYWKKMPTIIPAPMTARRCHIICA
jgi:hypothetical protein